MKIKKIQSILEIGNITDTNECPSMIQTFKITPTNFHPSLKNVQTKINLSNATRLEIILTAINLHGRQCQCKCRKISTTQNSQLKLLFAYHRDRRSVSVG